MKPKSIMLYATVLMICYAQILFAVPFSQEVSKHKPIQAKAFNAQVAAVAIPFISNMGQVDSRVQFYAKTFGGTG